MRALQVEHAMQWGASSAPQELTTEVSAHLGLQNILCVSDLHAHEDFALQRASMLSRQFHAHVHVLYVDSQRISEPILHLIRRPETFAAAPPVDMFLEKPRQGSTDVRSVVGRLPAALAQIDAQFSIDMIVMSAHDVQNMPQLDNLIRRARAPVLIARGRPLEAYRHVTLATDLTKHSLRLFAAMDGFEWLNARKISLVHAFGLPYRGLRETPGTIPEHLESYRNQWQRLVLRQLQDDVAKSSLDANRAKLRADLAMPLDLIQRELAESSSDLLVAGRSRWAMRLKEMLGRSTTRKILQSVDRDVLIVP